MKTLNKYILSLVVILAFALNSAIAQTNSYKLLSESSMTINGTSTIHDWEADVEKINLKAEINDSLLQAEALSSAGFIQSLSVTVPVESIESGKGGMNRKIYGALKEKDHPNITYVFSDAELVSSDKETSGFSLNATGKLTVAGKTQTINFPVQGTINGTDSLRLEGSYSLNMKDYDVDPPSAVFGTIKAGEEVTISFDILISSQTIANN